MMVMRVSQETTFCEDMLVKSLLTKVWSRPRPTARNVHHPETAKWEAGTISRPVTMRAEAMKQLSLSITLNKELSVTSRKLKEGWKMPLRIPVCYFL